MNKLTTATALLGLMGAFACPAHAMQAGANATTGYASQLSPIYPPQEQQTGQMWGTTEVVRCPDNYALAFELPSVAGTAPNPPTCKPIPSNSISGGVQ